MSVRSQERSNIWPDILLTISNRLISDNFDFKIIVDKGNEKGVLDTKRTRGLQK